MLEKIGGKALIEKEEIILLTKSDLVLRDIDLFKQFNNVEVGLTVTSTDDTISRYFEKYAPDVSKRFKALKKLNEEGIRTYAFVGPLLPHFVSEPDKLDALFEAIYKTGTKDNFSPFLVFFRNKLGNLFPYYSANSIGYTIDLDYSPHLYFLNGSLIVGLKNYFLLIMVI